MPRQLLLHVGSHKTGTSSFQAFLVNQSDALRQRGVSTCPILLDSRDRFARDGAVSGHGGLRQLMRNNKFKQYFDTVFTHLTHDNQVDTFVISDEHLSLTRQRITQQEIKQLSAYFEDIRVYLSLRHPYEFIWSFYKEYCTWMAFRVVSFETFIQFILPRYFDYPSTLQHFSKLRGVTFNVHAYRSDSFVDGDLLNRINPENDNPLDMSTVQRSNASIPDVFFGEYLKAAGSHTGDAKARINTLFQQYMQAVSPESFPRIGEVRPVIERSKVVRKPQAVLRHFGLEPQLPKENYIYGGSEKQPFSAFLDKTKLVRGADLSNKPDGWGLSSLISANGEQYKAFIAFHAALDFKQMIVFVDSDEDLEQEVAEDKRIRLIHLSKQYWSEALENDDLDSKICHCHERARAIFREAGIAWQVHLDGDEFLATQDGNNDISQLLATYGHDFDTIRLPVFELVYNTDAKPGDDDRTLLRRPTMPLPNFWSQRVQLQASFNERLDGVSDKLNRRNASIPFKIYRAMARRVIRVLKRNQRYLFSTNWTLKIAHRLYTTYAQMLMLTRPRNFSHRPRLLGTSQSQAWHDAQSNGFAGLNKFGFRGHQSGRTFVRTHVTVAIENSHRPLLEHANATERDNLPGCFIVHEDAPNFEAWREKFALRTEISLFSVEMEIRRKIQSLLAYNADASTAEAIYQQLYGLDGQQIAQGLEREYLVHPPSYLLHRRKTAATFTINS